MSHYVDSSYSIKVNQAEGTAEVLGSDKDWVAAQLEKVLAYLAEAPVTAAAAATNDEQPAGDERPRRRAAKAPRAKRAAKANEASAVVEKLDPPHRAKLEAFRKEREPHFKSKQDQAAIIA